MDTVIQRIEALQAAMAEERIEAYIVPTADYHGSEYLCAHFRAREYFSGFTGSAGTLLVLRDGAYLFTDGRYFVQAARELRGSGIELMRMGEPGVPELEDFLFERLGEYARLGFDARLMRARAVRALASALSEKNVELCGALDLISPIWGAARPALPDAKLWMLGEEYAGESAHAKLKALRSAMEKEGADAWAMCDCEDIAWLLNLRGGDMPHTPVPLCFCFVEKDRVVLCVDADKRSDAVDAALTGLGVEFRPYEGVLGYAGSYGEGAAVMLEAAKVNQALFEQLNRDAIVIEAPDIIARGRIVKNERQAALLREAHVRDGAALVRFMELVKSRAGTEGFDEWEATRALDALRLQTEGCIGLSFESICAYGENAAVVHYQARKESAAPIGKDGILLADSGAHYMQGTTDVTRSIVLGEATAEEKRHFTLVLKGMLALMQARFPADTEGGQLDAIARYPIWQAGLDYKHGTGHGVGFLLGVHEDPVRIRHKNGGFRFAPGMVVSDEPGLYIEGSHGIRLENQLLCVGDGTGPYGDFLRFECLTLAPIDLGGVELSMLDAREREALNAYHARVREALLPCFDAEEDAAVRAFLLEATRAV